MRTRKVVLGIAAIAVTVVSGISAATAGTLPNNDYAGTVENDPYTYFGFDLVKKHGKAKVENVEATLSYSCNHGPGGRANAMGVGSITAKNGKFSGTVKIKSFGARGGMVLSGSGYKVKGKLPKHGKAKGTVDGTLVIASARGGSPQRCYTGRVDYKVSRSPSSTPRAGR